MTISEGRNDSKRATVTFERTTFNANTAREAAAVSVEGASTVQFLSSVFTANIGQQFGVVKVMARALS